MFIEYPKRILEVQDPSSHETAAGWPLRNVLTYLSSAHGISTLRVLLRREGSSRIATVAIDESALQVETRPGVVGWEKNDKGKLGPRMANLAPLMDPTR